MNIVTLAAGKSRFKIDGDEQYPICLTEIEGQPLINLIIESIGGIKETKFIFIIRKSHVERYHLDNSLNQLVENNSLIILDTETKGAACSALMAIDKINNNDELLLMSADEYLSEDPIKIIDTFRDIDCDAGTIIFESIHPRYSYVKVNKEGLVSEAAEKNPISNNATVGFYWFRRGSDFVSAAMNTIKKNASINGLFYICPVFNELLLAQKKIATYQIETSSYHPIKSKRQLDTI